MIRKSASDVRTMLGPDPMMNTETASVACIIKWGGIANVDPERLVSQYVSEAKTTPDSPVSNASRMSSSSD